MIKYNSAFNKIKVTSAMEKRIESGIERESLSTSDRLRQKKFSPKYKTYAYAIAACCVLAFSIAIIYFSLIAHKNTGTNVGIANPYQEFSSVDELKKVLSYDLNIPTKMPSSYKISKIGILGGSISQITYINDNKTILFRTAEGKEDISGDYNEYSKIISSKISGKKVTFKGKGSIFYLAVWYDDTCSYSISASGGMPMLELLKIIQSMKYF